MDRLLYVLNKFADTGHCYVPRDKESVGFAAQNNTVAKRNTCLVDRLRDLETGLEA